MSVRQHQPQRAGIATATGAFTPCGCSVGPSRTPPEARSAIQEKRRCTRLPLLGKVQVGPGYENWVKS